MKLEPVTKPSGQFGEIRKSDSGRNDCKTYIFINSNLLCYKNRK